MRVLHCHSGNLFGGVERALLALVQARGTRLESTFALCFDGKFANSLRSLQNTPAIIGAVRYRFPWTVWSARRRLTHVVRSQRPDWLFVHGLWGLKLAYPVARLTGTPIAFWAHDAFQGSSWLERPHNLSPDRLLANSQFTASTVPSVFPGRWPEVVSPPSLGHNPPLASRTRLRLELGVEPETVAILMAARFEPWKGHEMLFDGLDRLRTLLPAKDRWNVWIAGHAQRPRERELEAKLRSRALAHGDRVRFLGHRDDLAAVYSAADIYCQPNAGPEPYGLTFVEAAAAGLPLISTRLGAPTEWINESMGRLVPPRDPGALARALAELIASATLRRQLGAAAMKRAEKLPTPTGTAERLVQVLEGAYLTRATG